MAARLFLYTIAGLIMLTLAAALGWDRFQDQLMRLTFVPSAPFATPDRRGAPDYAEPSAWVARPGLADDPSHWTPAGFARTQRPRAAIFFVPPTTYLNKGRWNAPLDDAGANDRLRLFVASQASAFNGVGEVWAPRYRQATMGAFLTGEADAGRALDFAYGDVASAFDAFVAAVPRDRPIILAGHSQGSLHLLRLLAQRVAGKPIAKRIVAVYAIGWPISLTADMPALGLPACTRAGEAACVVGWQSFAEPADPSQILAVYDETVGLAGLPRRGTPMLCVNPLTGAPASAAPASANLGALVPSAGLADADLVAGKVPARCDPRGLLLIGPPPEGYGRFVLRGENYHVFDYALFWANLRADAASRLATYLAAR